MQKRRTGWIDVQPLPPADIEPACRLTVSNLPGLQFPMAVVRAVYAHNPESFLGFYRERELVGVYAMLMLDRLGMEQLLAGELDTQAPPLAALAPAGQAPAAIYKWVVVAPGQAAVGICQVSYLLQQHPYRSANLYARPVTPAGQRIMENLGFRPLSGGRPGLFRYVRMANRPMKLECAA